jgi:hypothetical protein
MGTTLVISGELLAGRCKIVVKKKRNSGCLPKRLFADSWIILGHLIDFSIAVVVSIAILHLFLLIKRSLFFTQMRKKTG